MTDSIAAAGRPLTIVVRYLPHGEGLPLPEYATEHSAGVDLMAAVAEDEPIRLAPGDWCAVPTGLSIALPPGYEAQVRPRSGLAFKHAVTVLNAPGTIDADYRGEVKVLLINHGRDIFEISRGLRIAQMLIAPVTTVGWRVADALSETGRGTGGFGSTGGMKRE
jgi:dUTP pyrophosphatase